MRPRLGPYLPQIAFSLALILGAGMTFAVHHSTEQRALAQFQREADLAVDRIFTRLRQHVVVLRGAQGLFAASGGGVSREEFRRFLAAFVGKLVDDRSGEVLDLGGSDLEPPPPFRGGIPSGFLLGVGKVGERFVILLDVNHLLSAEDQSALSGIPGPEAS